MHGIERPLWEEVYMTPEDSARLVIYHLLLALAEACAETHR